MTTWLISIALLSLVACTTGGSSAAADEPEPTSTGSVEEAAPSQLEPSAIADAFASASLRGILDADLRVAPPAPKRPRISDAQLQRVRERMEDVLARESLEGHVLGAHISDLESGQVVFERNDETPLKPASNTKLFTTAAALELLGVDYRFETKVFATGDVEDGVLDGDLVLLGHHDFTLSDEFYEHWRDPLDRLAEQVAATGIERVDGAIVAAGELVVQPHRYGTLDVARERKETAKEFRRALRRAGVSSESRKTSEAHTPPEGARVLASWKSVPLSVATVPINRMSHNEMADSLMRHIGWVRRGESSYEAGAAETKAWLERIGIGADGFELHDGSGLSHDNRVTARQLADLIEHVQTMPYADVWNRTLSVAGEWGTYAGRMRGAHTRGRVFVKSGTLDGVITTSGYLVNKHDGRTYVVVLLMNEVEGREGPRAAQNRLVEAVAVDLFPEIDRPLPPTLRYVRNLGDGDRIEIGWDAVDGAAGYWVWTAPDGVRFERMRYTVADATLVLRDLAPDDVVHVRLTAIGADGGESDPSDAYPARVASVPSRVLLVDANDRWQAMPADENPSGASHAFLRHYAAALGGIAFDSADDDVVGTAAIDLDTYSAVMWAAGEESGASVFESRMASERAELRRKLAEAERALVPDDEDSVDAVEGLQEDLAELDAPDPHVEAARESWKHDAIEPAAREALTSYLEHGGRLFITGSEIAFDLDRSRRSDTSAFCSNTLHATCAADDARTFTVHGVGGAFTDLPTIRFFTPGEMYVRTPDVLEPVGEATPVMSYEGGAGGVAGVQFDGDYKLVHLGFPFESIDNPSDRAAVMAGVLEFFDL